MRPRVYVETSVISYLTARQSRDVVVAGHQQVTQDWWVSAQERYELTISQLVIDEASAGDELAARERIRVLTGLTLLAASEDALKLAQEMLASGLVPTKAAEDALHIAICVTNGIDYLVTWNCRHIANATIRHSIEQICRSAGYEPPIICTPDELVEVK
ncbi:hypothetical protein MNBD_GAMMA26-358 [hydrothermal vent metagenome]|uniref:PIN domain-containing protein n=1 Tax=hydrothermal vent metagenome TaxID=652676 RepID=A0A3B1BGJ2_9ZZZZ